MLRSLEPVSLSRLDYVGVAYVGAAAQEKLAQYAASPAEQRSLEALIASLVQEAAP